MAKTMVLQMVALVVIVSLPLASLAVEPIRRSAPLANARVAMSRSQAMSWVGQSLPIATQDAESAPDLSGYPAAAMPHLLAWGKVNERTFGRPYLALRRVLVPARTAQRTQRSKGPTLFYVEAGRIDIAVNGRLITYDQGSSLIVQWGQIYAVFNNEFQAASLLILDLLMETETTKSVGRIPEMMYFYAPPDITPVAPDFSGELTLTTSRVFAAQLELLPPTPFWLFIASVTWPPGLEFGDHAHSGPVGLTVTSGTLTVSDFNLEAGACLVLPANTRHRVAIAVEATAPAEFLMAGAFEVGKKLVVSDPSTTGGGGVFSLSCGDEAR